MPAGNAGFSASGVDVIVVVSLLQAASGSSKISAISFFTSFILDDGNQPVRVAYVKLFTCCGVVIVHNSRLIIIWCPKHAPKDVHQASVNAIKLGGGHFGTFSPVLFFKPGNPVGLPAFTFVFYFIAGVCNGAR